MLRLKLASLRSAGHFYGGTEKQLTVHSSDLYYKWLENGHTQPDSYVWQFRILLLIRPQKNTTGALATPGSTVQLLLLTACYEEPHISNGPKQTSENCCEELDASGI